MLVLGIGNSATDIAVESSRVARGDVPGDAARCVHRAEVHLRRADRPPHRQPARPRPVRAAEASRWARCCGSRTARSPTTACPSPTTRCSTRTRPSATTCSPGSGTATSRSSPTSTASRASKVFFVDGTAVEADVVVYCTGYKVTFPFLDEEIVRADDNHVDLYRRVVSTATTRGSTSSGWSSRSARSCRWPRSRRTGSPTWSPATVDLPAYARCAPRSRRTTRPCASATSPRSGTPSRSTSTSTAPSSARSAKPAARSVHCIRGIHTAYPSPLRAVDSPTGGAGCRSGRHCWRCWSRGRCTATSSGRSSSSGPGRPGRSTSGRSTRP